MGAVPSHPDRGREHPADSAREGDKIVPAKLHRELESKASAKGLTGDRRDAYVYGTMRKTGWVPSHEKLRAKVKKLRGK